MKSLINSWTFLPVVLASLIFNESAARANVYVGDDGWGAYTIHVPEADIETVRSGALKDIPGVGLVGAIVVAADDLCGRRGVHMSGHVLFPLLTTPPLCGE